MMVRAQGKQQPVLGIDANTFFLHVLEAGKFEPGEEAIEEI